MTSTSLVTLAVGLAEDLALAVDLGHQQFRKCIHTRNAHTVQTARDLVASLVELTAGVQHRQHDLEGRFALLLVEVRRDAAPVVAHRHRVVLVDRYLDARGKTRQRFVDRVVHHLVDQVMEALLTDVADVHGRPFAHGLQALEDLDVRGGILSLLPRYFPCFFAHFKNQSLTHKGKKKFRILQFRGCGTIFSRCGSGIRSRRVIFRLADNLSFITIFCYLCRDDEPFVFY